MPASNEEIITSSLCFVGVLYLFIIPSHYLVCSFIFMFTNSSALLFPSLVECPFTLRSSTLSNLSICFNNSFHKSWLATSFPFAFLHPFFIQPTYHRSLIQLHT